MEIKALGNNPAQWLNSVPVLGSAATGFRDFLNLSPAASPLDGVVTPKSSAITDWNQSSATRVSFSKSGDELLSGFRQRLQELMAQRGMSLGDQPLVLQADDLGGVTVANSHPDAEIINTLIADDTNLGSWFQQLQSEAQAGSGTSALDDVTGKFQVALWDKQAVGRWGR